MLAMLGRRYLFRQTPMLAKLGGCGSTTAGNSPPLYISPLQ